MKISVFLSYPKPHLKHQTEFIEKIREHLRVRGFTPRTLGVTDYDMSAPLKAIRRLNGIQWPDHDCVSADAD